MIPKWLIHPKWYPSDIWMNFDFHKVTPMILPMNFKRWLYLRTHKYHIKPNGIQINHLTQMIPNEPQRTPIIPQMIPKCISCLNRGHATSKCDILYTGLCWGYVHYFYLACFYKVNTQHNYNLNVLPDIFQIGLVPILAV